MKLVIISMCSLMAIGGTTTNSQDSLSRSSNAQRLSDQNTRAFQNRPQHIRDFTERTMEGTRGDCPFVEVPIFDTVAHPMEVNCSFSLYYHHSDIDGDGIVEGAGAYAAFECYWCKDGICLDEVNESYGSLKTRLVGGSNPPELVSETYLYVDPTAIDYEGLDIIDYYNIYHMANVDVTGDGRPDALISVTIYQGDCGWDNSITYYYYVENISQSPVACATDINNDGSTNVNDLLAVVGNWGPCE